MRIVFRVDASRDIGTGHVMRCLTLAEALRSKGHECSFISRLHLGNLITQIQKRGFKTHSLPAASTNYQIRDNDPPHIVWLGVSPEIDAKQSTEIISEIKPDWLVVDHYALNSVWENEIKYHVKIMVIDDLADRNHSCNLLLDQTYKRIGDDYKNLVPPEATLLCGAKYALLRPEFEKLRGFSLRRRNEGQLRHILITMGGVDKDNVTCSVLKSICSTSLNSNCQITVVMGAMAPWVKEVKSMASKLPWSTQVVCGVDDMAERMCKADLAIGAAGATSWERCCLGLPTILVVLAENQKYVAHGLKTAEAAKVIESAEKVSTELPIYVNDMAAISSHLTSLSKRAADIVDGEGVGRVIEQMEAGSCV